MKRPELLAPAGSFEKAKTAFMYGADAVYCGTGALSLRSRAEVNNDDLAKTIEYAHGIEKKVYATINIYAWDEYYEEMGADFETFHASYKLPDGQKVVAFGYYGYDG